MKKRLLSALLALVMLIGLVPVMGTEAEAATAITASTFNSKLQTFRDQVYNHNSYYKNNDSNTLGYECFGYANYIARYIFGSFPCGDMSGVGVRAGWTITHGGAAVDSLHIGDIVRYRNHSIFITSISGNTIYYTQANIPGGSNKVTWDNSISRSSLKSLVAQNLTSGASSITQKIYTGWVAHYQGWNDATAPTYARISTAKESFAVGESVTFSLSSDGTVNTVWVYYPDGTSRHFPDNTTSFTTAFSMPGNYQALVQAWNGVGSKTSDRITFRVGPPTWVTLSTNKQSYNIGETVKFTFDSDGNPKANTLWIYLPDGTSKYYKNNGQYTTSYSDSFTMPGDYQALVQAWNGIGSKTSDRVSFRVGPPTWVTLSTDKKTYNVGETVRFTFDSDGNPKANTLWIYLPDGTSKYYENSGQYTTSYSDSFTMPGDYQALVQAWNSVGSQVSERVSFKIVSPAPVHTHTMTKTAAKAAACTAQGNREYWTCSGCGKYFSDANGNTEITLASTKIAALGHNYVSGTCTRCGAKDPNYTEPTPPAPAGASVTVATVNGKAGGTVEVPVTIANNPGIVGMMLDVTYDASALTLTDVRDGGILGTAYHNTGELDKNPYRLAWGDYTATSNITANGTAATLVFSVKSGASDGKYPVTVAYKHITDAIYDMDFNAVEFAAVDGGVNVTSFLMGDVNRDGKVTPIDTAYLARYLAGWSAYTEANVDLAAADVNGDGKVSPVDTAVLARHLAGWSAYAALPYKK